MFRAKSALLTGLIAVAIALGCIVQSADAGEIHDGNLLAMWSYTYTVSSSSAYSAKSTHFCYAQQDGIRRGFNSAPGYGCEYTLYGSASNHNDGALAGYGTNKVRIP